MPVPEILIVQQTPAYTQETAERHVYCMQELVLIIHLLLAVQTTRLTVDSPSVHTMRRIVEQNFHPRIFIPEHRHRVPVYAPKHSHPHVGLDRSLRQQCYGSMRQCDVSQTHFFQHTPNDRPTMSEQLRLQVKSDGTWAIAVHPHEAEALESSGEAAQVVEQDLFEHDLLAFAQLARLQERIA